MIGDMNTIPMQMAMFTGVIAMMMATVGTIRVSRKGGIIVSNC